jgi:hypothetical protein
VYVMCDGLCESNLWPEGACCVVHSMNIVETFECSGRVSTNEGAKLRQAT